MTLVEEISQNCNYQDMNQTDGTIDYSKYAQKDLMECLSNIDRESNPKNFAVLIAEIENRKQSGRWDEKDSEFQDILASRRDLLTSLVCRSDCLFLFGWSRNARKFAGRILRRLFFNSFIRQMEDGAIALSELQETDWRIVHK